MRGMFDFKAKDYQQEFALTCLNNKRVVAVWCRQSGKSETVSKIAIMLARIDKSGDVLIFAPTDRQTELLAAKIDYNLTKMPYLSYFHCKRRTQREFYFNNGRAIKCMTANVLGKGETLRGATGGDIIIEEAGSIKDFIISSVILPMGATTDPTIIKIGTPRGKNHFFESSKSPQYKLLKFDYTYPVKAGLIKADYIEEQRQLISDIEFRTEYGAEFIEDSDAFFGYELIESCVDEHLDITPKEIEQGYHYYIGADIARLGQDSTCFIVIKTKDKKAEIVRIIEKKKSLINEAVDEINSLISYYKPKRVFIDETGLGAGVTDMLAKQHNQMRVHKGTSITGFPKQGEYFDKIVGVKFTIQSKLDMFSNLKVIMQTERLRLPRHQNLIAQLRDFRYEITENQNIKLHHSEHGHDDLCDALALACKEVNIKSIGYAI